MSKEKISQFLGIPMEDAEVVDHEPSETSELKTFEIEPYNKNNTLSDDVVIAKESISDAIQKAHIMLDSYMTQTIQSGTAMEMMAVAKMIDTIVRANKDMISISKDSSEHYNENSDSKTVIEGNVTHNNLIISSEELLSRVIEGVKQK